MSSHNSRMSLRKQLRELALLPLPSPSSAVESRLRAACRDRRKRRLRRRIQMLALGLAACLLLVLGWEWRASDRPLAPPRTPNYAGFLALPYAQTDVPLEEAIVVRVNVRPADLEVLGLPPALVIGRKPMPADLLIGQDGIARAVRFTQ